VARETKSSVTVALTGDAGDELFGGYERYRALGLTEMFHKLPPVSRRILGGTMVRVLPRSARSKTRLRRLGRLFEHINESTESRYLGWMTTFDESARMGLYSEEQLDRLTASVSELADPAIADPAELFASAFARGGRRDRITRAMVADMLTYLPGDLLVKVDIASMAHSLECRAPFLDHRIVELAAAMPLSRKLDVRTGASKVVLKRAFADLLPPAIRRRSKMGFGVPIGSWFRGELRNELEEVLLDPVCFDRGLFRPEAIRKLVAEHVAGKQEHAPRLWALLMLEMWFRQHLGSSG
jgi:asparagine synthase (glutamine-hydrolysing)